MTKTKSEKCIVSGHARMWPRALFAPISGTPNRAGSLDFMNQPGIYILYKGDIPFYIGKADVLWKRLRTHARQVEGPRYHFWDFFSAFVVLDKGQRDELESILIAAMPTANSARPNIQKDKMPKPVHDILIKLYDEPK
jgi:hypothetical protein